MIYRGAQGIWVHQLQTGKLTPDRVGVAVSVLHTGETYADDLFEDGLIYHYPKTVRGRKDEREAQALKYAEAYRLPLFVILHSKDKALRDVKTGWVAGHDDETKQCLILFGEIPLALRPTLEDQPFRLDADRIEKQRTVTQRERSPRFQFEVTQRYGPQCAFCDICDPRLLEAAHIRPVSENGSDDPRNGLVLCANHHKAFDKGLVAVRPPANELVPLDAAITLKSIGISRTTIIHLRESPHADAINWRWTRDRGT